MVYARFSMIMAFWPLSAEHFEVNHLMVAVNFLCVSSLTAINFYGRRLDALILIASPMTMTIAAYGTIRFRLYFCRHLFYQFLSVFPLLNRYSFHQCWLVWLSPSAYQFYCFTFMVLFLFLYAVPAVLCQPQEMVSNSTSTRRTTARGTTMRPALMPFPVLAQRVLARCRWAL